MSTSTAEKIISDNDFAPNEFDLPSRRDESTYYNLQKMNQLHHEIVRRIVVGQKDHMIADALGVTKATIKYTRESPIVKQKLAIMMGARDASTLELQKQITALAPLALHTMSEIMVDSAAPHGVRSSISQDILDRAGFKPANVSLIKDERFTQTQLDAVKERARASGVLFRADEIEDAEFSDNNDEEENDESN